MPPIEDREKLRGNLKQVGGASGGVVGLPLAFVALPEFRLERAAGKVAGDWRFDGGRPIPRLRGHLEGVQSGLQPTGEGTRTLTPRLAGRSTQVGSGSGSGLGLAADEGSMTWLRSNHCPPSNSSPSGSGSRSGVRLRGRAQGLPGPPGARSRRWSTPGSIAADQHHPRGRVPTPRGPVWALLAPVLAGLPAPTVCGEVHMIPPVFV